MVAKYRQIADIYRGQIEAGELRPGQQLPTEAELSRVHSAAIGTIRSALQVLQGEGLIYPDSPRGWFVSKREHMIYRPQSDGRTLESLKHPEPWVQQILAEGREPTQSIDVAIVVPPPAVAERLNLKEDESAVLRARVRSINGAPVNIADSYYPKKMVDGSAVESPKDIPEGVSRVLVGLGYVQTKAVDEIEVRMPTPDEQRRLQLGIGVPVAVHRVTTFTADGTPVRCSINVLPGDRHVIIYEREWDVKA